MEATEDRRGAWLLDAGVLIERHWDEIKESLPDDIRHELGACVGKVRNLEAVLKRERERGSR